MTDETGKFPLYATVDDEIRSVDEGRIFRCQKQAESGDIIRGSNDRAESP